MSETQTIPSSRRVPLPAGLDEPVTVQGEVDVSLLWENLRLTPEQRLRAAVARAAGGKLRHA